MRICVISLKRSLERRKAVAEQFARTALQFEFFDAIDGNEQAARHFLRFDPHTYRLNTYRDPSPGEIACYASHLELWKYSARTNEPLVILEDDCQLSASFESAVRAAEQLVERFGFIRLQGSLRRRRFHIDHGAHMLHIIEGFRLYYLERVPLCLTGYVVNPGTAAQLAAASTTLNAPVDKFVQRTWDHRAPIFGLEPGCVSVSPLGARSTIGDRSVGAREPATMIRRARYKLKNSLMRKQFNASQLAALGDASREKSIPPPTRLRVLRHRNSASQEG